MQIERLNKIKKNKNMLFNQERKLLLEMQKVLGSIKISIGILKKKVLDQRGLEHISTFNAFSNEKKREIASLTEKLKQQDEQIELQQEKVMGIMKEIKTLDLLIQKELRNEMQESAYEENKELDEHALRIKESRGTLFK